MAEKQVYFYRYYGLALCKNKGKPIHAYNMDELPSKNDIAKQFNGLDEKYLRIASLTSKEFHGKEWPQ